MEMRDKLLSGLQRAQLLGLEIGALNRPITRKSEGPVIYVDHFDTNGLREKYRNDPNVNVEAIVDVEAVWGVQTLAQCIGETRKVDYVVASHVIEHVPDLITWLEEISAILTSTGELRLVVPDRRFTFDFFRNETRFCDIVATWMVRARRPQPQQIADHMLNVTQIDAAAAWRETPNPANRRAMFDFAGVRGVITDSLTNGTYHDVHCSIFTPASFAALMQDILHAGLTDFGCAFFHDTEPGQLEFIVAMKRMADPAEAIRSWRTMQQAAKDLPPGAGPNNRGGLPSAVVDDLRVVVPRLQDALGSLMQVLNSQNETGERQADRESLRTQLDLIKRSTSWRFTAPIRAAVDAVRRQRSRRAST